MATAVLVMSMRGHSSKTNYEMKQQPEQLAVFHDFLGGGVSGSGASRNSESDPDVVLVSKSTYKTNQAADSTGGTDAVVRLSKVPSASGSVSAASGAGRGTFSVISDLGSGSGSERQEGCTYERMARYGPRGDMMVPELFAGRKQSNLDSVYTGASEEGSRNINPESMEISHLVKLQMLRNGVGGERPRISYYDGPSHAVPPIRPGSSSLMLQQRTGLTADTNLSRWEQSVSMNVGGSFHYGPHVPQASSLGYPRVASNRVRDRNLGPSVVSQTAADEGSRTGIKGSSILNPTSASKGVLEKPAAHNSEPESFTPPIQHGVISAGRQMTVVYGGQVHVFDDVHPNKADVIMALAGSNGGSWSINLPKSSARANLNEQHNRENDSGGSHGRSREMNDTRMSIQTVKSHKE